MQLILFHLSVISLYSYAFWYDQKYVEVPYPSKEFEHIPLKARAIFFTFWTLWYIDYKCRLFNRIKQIRHNQRGTGGGPGVPTSVTPLEERIASLLGVGSEVVGRSGTPQNEVQINPLSVLQTVYFVVSLLNDLIGTNAVTKKPPLIRQIKDVLFSITLCTALYVVLVFWIFYTFAKSAIFPIEAEEAFPVWLNHLMHTLILPIILIELLITKRNYPSKETGFSVSIILTAMYAGYIHIVYFKYGIWPYPFMYVVSTATKIFYFIGSGLLGMGFYLLGEKFDALVSQKNSTRVAYLNGAKKIH